MQTNSNRISFLAKWSEKVVLGIVVLLWSALAGFRLLDAWQNARIIPALLAAQAGLMAWLLITRRRQAGEARWQHKVGAWISALLPLALRIHHETLVGQIITVLGLLIALWAMWTLGRSFGVAPADRGLVREGPYRWLRHPMYLGELVALSGADLGNPTPWNSLVLLILLITLLLRIQWEETAITGYAIYIDQVRWRMIPFLY